MIIRDTLNEKERGKQKVHLKTNIILLGLQKAFDVLYRWPLYTNIEGLGFTRVLL